MTEEKKQNKPRPRHHNHKNKEQGSYKPRKKRWKKHHKKPKKDLNKSLQELQSYINGRYHNP